MFRTIQAKRTKPLELERELAVYCFDVLRATRGHTRRGCAIHPTQCRTEDGVHELSVYLPCGADDAEHQGGVRTHECQDSAEDQQEEDAEVTANGHQHIALG